MKGECGEASLVDGRLVADLRSSSVHSARSNNRSIPTQRILRHDGRADLCSRAAAPPAVAAVSSVVARRDTSPAFASATAHQSGAGTGPGGLHHVARVDQRARSVMPLPSPSVPPGHKEHGSTVDGGARDDTNTDPDRGTLDRG